MCGRHTRLHSGPEREGHEYVNRKRRHFAFGTFQEVVASDSRPVSEDDAKTFRHLCDVRVYGDVLIAKEECINHVSERLDTALRNMLTQGRKAGVTLGG